ncbi:MAG: GspE/PulE family protein [candidate division Zixibacteria bacterium]|nr:GspE/PulE family protein [candidate division Zixibacteria bacterium]
MESKKRIGELLLEKKLVTQKQLDEALKIQKKTGERVGDILIRQGVITEEDFLSIISEKLSIPKVNVDNLVIAPEVIRRVPVELAKKHRLIPILQLGGALTVAMVDPLDLIAVEELKYHTGLEINRVIAAPSQVQKAISDYYTVQDSVAEVVREMGLPTEEFGKELAEVSRKAGEIAGAADDAPIIRLVNLLLTQGIRDTASDIHIEPEEAHLRVRFRIHGLMREAANPPRELAPAIVSRIKIMANMDVSEKRLPQDGRFTYRVEKHEVDFRVSTLPTIFGEKVVLRILDKSSLAIHLDKIGLPAALLSRLRQGMKKPEGFILVTGPTGSGKTSTLYGMLRELNSVEKNIITVEDPVEYHIPFISQVQTNEKAGLFFANALRSILRQDPDIIMVGEIRDRETAEIAVRSALTGHLVLSTLHANDAPSTTARLLDMGVEAYLLAASLISVVAQRLVRRICPACKEKVTVPESLKKELWIDDPNAVFHRGAGCRECKQSGFSGRLGLFEMLVVTDSIRELIAGRSSTAAILAEARKQGMKLLRQDGAEKILAGLTTVEEVLRVTSAGDFADIPKGELIPA